jgi:uncharacterized protein with HEPN domain
MLEASEKVQHYLKNKTFEDFLQDGMLQDAVERNIGIIGEAARRISEGLKQEHPEIPWRKIIAQRNVLVHEYDDIEIGEIWEVATFHLPRLIDQVRPLIPPLPPEVDEKGGRLKVSYNHRMNFHRFIGIDWSGARNPGRGIQVAQCFSGKKVPEIINNRKQQNWRRKDIVDWLAELHHDGQRVLVGFDFAFAYPYCNENAYFPGHDRSPKNAESLWELIDNICQGARDFYGGPFYLNQTALFADYLLYQTYTGQHYSNRMRISEQLYAEKWGNPSSVFRCVGPGSVGIGSVAGMRLLHYINSRLNKDFLIWPFQREDNSRSVIIEIYPTLFYRLAGENPIDWRDNNVVNKAFKHFGSDPLPSDPTVKSRDHIDAIISAAAIRHLSNNKDSWQPKGLNNCAKGYEGWIFGVV